MSFLTDVFEGNFSNLGHDLTAHFGADLPWYLGGAAAGIGGLGAAGIGPAAGLFAPAATTGADAAALGVGGAAGSEAAGTIPAAASLTEGGGGAAGSYVFPTGTGEMATIPAGATSTVGGGAAGGAGFDWSKFLTNNVGSLAGAGVGGAALLSQLMQPKGAGALPGGADVSNIASMSQAQQQQLVQALLTQNANQQAQFAPIIAGGQATEAQLLDPLTSGKLPPAAEQSVVNAVNDAKAATKSRYASLGLTGSTAETDALAAIDNNAIGQRFSIAQNMANTALQAGNQALSALSTSTGATGSLLGQVGAAETASQGIQAQIYQTLMNQQISQNKDLQTAIGNFTTALGKVQGSQGGTKVSDSSGKLTLSVG